MNLLHISDIHFRKAYERCETGYKGMLYSMQSPLIPLEQCLNTALKIGELDLIIISGDLTESGRAEDYAFLKNFLRERIGKAKIIVTLGNHDRKAEFRKGWMAEEASDLPYNQICRCGDLVVISVDSSQHGDSQGKIRADQLAWLKAAFQKTEGSPAILVTHHHILKEQSALRELDGAPGLLNLIRHENVLCILNGHTHHNYVGTAAGTDYFTAGSMSFCGEDMEDGIVRFEEKYGYHLLQIECGKIVSRKTESFTTGRQIKTIFCR